MFLGNSPNMGGGAPQCSGGLTFGGTKQRTSVVRWEFHWAGKSSLA
jgi:nuclear transcription factor Y alpha